ncbi:MAG: hypothetical protein IKF90_06645 [Parasporobacterium sp.]|nr:hypothetical protein [Parasporobacterium sp.]
MKSNFTSDYFNASQKFYDEESNSIEWINPKSWNREKLFTNYLGSDFPYIVVTANVDVTKPLAFAKKHGISFNLVMIYLCTKTADSIENYRYRFIDGKPFLIDHSRPFVTHLKKGSDLFVMGECVWPCDDIVRFCKASRENLENAAPEDLKNRVSGKLDIINYSSIPWIQYTAFIRTVIHCGEDNVPKITFGKYYKDPTDPKRTLMPLSNQTHHGLMDGLHVGRFYAKLQEACDVLE